MVQYVVRVLGAADHEWRRKWELRAHEQGLEAADGHTVYRSYVQLKIMLAEAGIDMTSMGRRELIRRQREIEKELGKRVDVASVDDVLAEHLPGQGGSERRRPPRGISQAQANVILNRHDENKFWNDTNC